MGDTFVIWIDGVASAYPHNGVTGPSPFEQPSSAAVAPCRRGRAALARVGGRGPRAHLVPGTPGRREHGGSSKQPQLPEGSGARHSARDLPGAGDRRGRHSAPDPCDGGGSLATQVARSRLGAAILVAAPAAVSGLWSFVGLPAAGLLGGAWALRASRRRDLRSQVDMAWAIERMASAGQGTHPAAKPPPPPSGRLGQTRSARELPPPPPGSGKTVW